MVADKAADSTNEEKKNINILTSTRSVIKPR